MLQHREKNKIVSIHLFGLVGKGIIQENALQEESSHKNHFNDNYNLV